MTRHTLPWKQREVEEISKLANEYPNIGIVDISMFPANLFAEIRKKLKEKAILKVSKTRIIKKALEKTRLKDTKLMEEVKGICGIVFTKDNPFELFAFLKKNKGNSSAKEGMIAPADIIIPAGDTGLPPGPALSDLKKVGLKVKIDGATIAITNDKVVTKEGEVINADVANTLGKLDIKPIKIGLNLRGIIEGNEFYLPNILDIDIDEVFANFQSAHMNAFNLACNMAYVTPVTAGTIIRKATREAYSVAIEANIYNKETIEHFIGKANSEGIAVKGLVKDVVPETKAEVKTKTATEPKEVIKQEEKSEKNSENKA